MPPIRYSGRRIWSLDRISFETVGRLWRNRPVETTPRVGFTYLPLVPAHLLHLPPSTFRDLDFEVVLLVRGLAPLSDGSE